MNTQPDSKQELLASENKQSSQKCFWDDSEFDRAMQELYDSGYFEPRELKKHKSGLVLAFLVPPEHHYSFDP